MILGVRMFRLLLIPLSGCLLNYPTGLNDGSVNGVSYFTCPPACGVFAKPDMFDLIGEEGESAAGTAGDG